MHLHAFRGVLKVALCKIINNYAKFYNALIQIGRSTGIVPQMLKQI